MSNHQPAVSKQLNPITPVPVFMFPEFPQSKHQKHNAKRLDFTGAIRANQTPTYHEVFKKMAGQSHSIAKNLTNINHIDIDDSFFRLD